MLGDLLHWCCSEWLIIHNGRYLLLLLLLLWCERLTLLLGCLCTAAMSEQTVGQY